MQINVTQLSLMRDELREYIDSKITEWMTNSLKWTENFLLNQSEELDGQRQRQSEHTEASAGTVRFLQPAVSSASGTMGTKPAQFIYIPLPGQYGEILNDEWICKLVRPENGDTESLSSGEKPA